MKKHYILGLLLLLFSFKNYAQSGIGNKIQRDSVTNYGTIYKYNTIYGVNAGFSPTSAYGAQDNTLIGYMSGKALSSDITYSSAINNTFIGSKSGFLSHGTTNGTFLGAFAGYSNKNSDKNSFIGAYAGYSNITGFNNTYIGFNAGYSNINSENTIIGTNAGYSAQMAYSTVIGNDAGGTAVGANNSVLLGFRAGYKLNANDVVFIGSQAGFNNTAGGSNIFIGSLAGFTNTIGVANVFLGIESGKLTSTGNNNTFLGYRTGLNNTTGSYNTFIGPQTGSANTTGSNNIFIGKDAGLVSNFGDQSVMIGNNAGIASNNIASSNSWNVFLGAYAGELNTTGIQNTYLGAGAGSTGANAGTLTNAVAIGFNAKVSANSSLVLGGTGVNAVNVGIGNTAPANTLEITSAAANSSGLRFTNLTSASTQTAANGVGLSVNATGDVILVPAGGGGGTLWSQLANGADYLIQNTSNKSVMIGAVAAAKTSANYKLYVETGILTEKVRISATANWPDYVFDHGYSLRPLSEVEQFFKLNKHLPEVPSAQEVAKQGVDVGSMDATLLKKIEELTLYLVEQQKEIKELKQKLAAIEEKK